MPLGYKDIVIRKSEFVKNSIPFFNVTKIQRLPVLHVFKNKLDIFFYRFSNHFFSYSVTDALKV